VEFLQGRASIPLAKFIESPVYSRDDEKTGLSYMQAWALTHFLTFGPGMKNGELLNRFFNELQHGVEQKKAFLETFGSFDEVQNRYDDYIQSFAFSTAVIPEPARLQQDNVAVHTMSLAETHAEVAAWLIRTRHWDKARELTDRALKEDPKLSLAESDNGFLQFNEGKDDEALKDFSAAVDLDPKNYIALFAKVMISSGLKSSGPAEAGATDKGLQRVLEIKPDFAPAYIELARLAVSKNQLDLALALSRKAEQLEPFRAGYHILTGAILLRMNHPDAAAAHAAYVAQRWSGSDRDEALELWNRVPAEQRTAETVPLAETRANSQTSEGIVKAVSCDGGNLQITVDVDGQAHIFKGKGYPVGFSDTLWFGSDHFNPCVHVQHLRAVLHYNASKDPAYTGDLIYVGFRDDLPLTNPATAQASAH
jgi:tetratricopeptide (TPR) repeat protein